MRVGKVVANNKHGSCQLGQPEATVGPFPGKVSEGGGLLGAASRGPSAPRCPGPVRT